MIGPLVLVVILVLADLSRQGEAWSSSSHPSNAGHVHNIGHLTSSSTRLLLLPQQLGSFEVLDITETSKANRRVALKNYAKTGGDKIRFETAWDWQKECLEQHVQRLTTETTSEVSLSQFLPFPSLGYDVASSGVDTVFMLQHSPIYTLGTGSDERFILSNNQMGGSKVPIVRMDRGGEVTYHGPGQLTVYPLLDLRNYKQDIHWYMRALEEVILLAIAKIPGFDLGSATRQDDTTGIWMKNHKVAAVGIKCKKWITMHGMAINVEETSLHNFDGIVPCGLEGRKVGCLNQFLREKGMDPITVEEFARFVQEALEEVFHIELVQES